MTGAESGGEKVDDGSEGDWFEETSSTRWSFEETGAEKRDCRGGAEVENILRSGPP